MNDKLLIDRVFVKFTVPINISLKLARFTLLSLHDQLKHSANGQNYTNISNYFVICSVKPPLIEVWRALSCDSFFYVTCIIPICHSKATGFVFGRIDSFKLPCLYLPKSLFLKFFSVEDHLKISSILGDTPL